jgi:mycofactocin precursor
MAESTAVAEATAEVADQTDDAVVDDVVVEDVLVEEVSIDGMCGVY